MTTGEEIDRQLAKDLKGAVKVLEERGWCQGGYMDSEGHVCVIGAIRTAVWGQPNYSPYATNVDHKRAIAAQEEFEAVFDDTVDAADFNDVEGRKKKEVVSGLKQARRNVKARLPK